MGLNLSRAAFSTRDSFGIKLAEATEAEMAAAFLSSNKDEMVGVTRLIYSPFRYSALLEKFCRGQLLNHEEAMDYAVYETALMFMSDDHDEEFYPKTYVVKRLLTYLKASRYINSSHFSNDILLIGAADGITEIQAINTTCIVTDPANFLVNCAIAKEYMEANQINMDLGLAMARLGRTIRKGDLIARLDRRIDVVEPLTYELQDVAKQQAGVRWHGATLGDYLRQSDGTKHHLVASFKTDPQIWSSRFVEMPPRVKQNRCIAQMPPKIMNGINQDIMGVLKALVNESLEGGAILITVGYGMNDTERFYREVLIDRLKDMMERLGMQSVVVNGKILTRFSEFEQEEIICLGIVSKTAVEKAKPKGKK